MSVQFQNSIDSFQKEANIDTLNIKIHFPVLEQAHQLKVAGLN